MMFSTQGSSPRRSSLMLSLASIALVVGFEVIENTATAANATAAIGRHTPAAVGLNGEFKGTATLSGKVEADRPFKVAKVRAINTDKNVLYMVFTHKGQYKAVGLLPGKYEVTVTKDGFSSDMQTFEATVGASATLDFKLRDGGPKEFIIAADYPLRAWHMVTDYRTYEENFPPGPEYEFMKKHCMACHIHDSPTYMPSHSRRKDEWLAAIKHHMQPGTGDLVFGGPTENRGPGHPFGEPLTAPDSLTEQEMDRIATYLGTNFPQGPRRGTRFDADDIPLDEEVLKNAMLVEYYVPLDPVHDKGKVRRQAQDAQVGYNGLVWYTENTSPSRVGVVNTLTAESRDYLLQISHAYPHGLTIDQDQVVWWAERDINYLARLDDPKTGKMSLFPADPSGTWAEVFGVHTPVPDSKGNIWASQIGTNKIVKWDREAGRVTLTPTYDAKHGMAYGMEVDKFDNVWVAEGFGVCSVGKFDQKTEKFTSYKSPFHTTYPLCDTFRVGANIYDGTAWYTVRQGYIGKIDPKTDKVTEFKVPYQNSHPYDIQLDMQENVWYSDGALGGAIVHFEEDTQKYNYYPLPQISDIARLSVSYEGAIWYTPRSGDRAGVGVLYPDVTKFKQIPSATDRPMNFEQFKNHKRPTRR